MKKLLLSLMVIVSLTAFTKAAELSVTVTNGTNIVLTGQSHVSSINVLSATANVIKFYDSSTNTTYYTNALYTNRFSYMTNLTVKVTNSLGYIYTNYLTGMYTTTISVPASLVNQLPVAVTINASAGVSQTIPVDLIFVNGIVVTATNSATVNISYR